MDYKNYILSRKEWMFCLCEGLAAGALAAWILYQSAWGLVLVVLFVQLCVKREKKKRSEQRKEALLLEFRDAMQSVTAALQAGYSMENAGK